MSALLTVSSTLMCPHGGTVSITTSNSKASAGDFLATAADTFVVQGCPFNIAGVLHPCMTVQWSTTALRSTVGGNPPLTMDSVGICYAADQAPQGPVLIQSTQAKALGL